MAKKARTPAPPRPVQAPQRRGAKSRPALDSGDRRARLWLGIFALSGVVAVAIVLAVILLSGGGGKKSSAGVPKVDPNSLPGLQRTPAPWRVDYAHMTDRLSPLGLNALSQEALAYHIHQHLDIFIDGKKVKVPALVGINDDSYITQLHSHDATGVIHVESPNKRTYTLGQFIWEWGVYFTKDCLGSYCAGGGKRWHVYVNGQPYHGDMTTIPLKAHEEIALAYPTPPNKVPKTYNWKGL